MRYAQHTEVSSERSKAEIERLLTRYGATSFASGWQGDEAVIQLEFLESLVQWRGAWTVRQLKQFDSLCLDYFGE